MTGKKGKGKPSKRHARVGKTTRDKAAAAEPSRLERRVELVVWAAPEPKPPTKRAVVEAICNHIIMGVRLHVACAREGISWQTLWHWKATDADLQALYARAREASAESFEEKATATAEFATADDVQVARLQVDTYKWRAKMANPNKFSDRPDRELEDLARVGLEALLAGAYEKRTAIK